jgi:hypothetical protein
MKNLFAEKGFYSHIKAKNALQLRGETQAVMGRPGDIQTAVSC